MEWGGPLIQNEFCWHKKGRDTHRGIPCGDNKAEMVASTSQNSENCQQSPEAGHRHESFQEEPMRPTP